MRLFMFASPMQRKLWRQIGLPPTRPIPAYLWLRMLVQAKGRPRVVQGHARVWLRWGDGTEVGFPVTGRQRSR
jgi:hypothetical protein